MINIIIWLQELLPFVHKNMPFLALRICYYSFFCDSGGHLYPLDTFLVIVQKTKETGEDECGLLSCQPKVTVMKYFVYNR